MIPTSQPVLVVMGVSGSGKSTVAAILAGQLGWDLEEGDDLHPDENVAKMASGQPLDDDDRLPRQVERQRGRARNRSAVGGRHQELALTRATPTRFRHQHGAQPEVDGAAG